MKETKKQFLERIRKAYDKEGIVRFEARLDRGRVRKGQKRTEIIVGASDYTCIYREWNIPTEHIRSRVCNIPHAFKSEFKYKGKTYYDLSGFWHRIQHWQGKWELLSFEFKSGEIMRDGRK